MSGQKRRNEDKLGRNNIMILSKGKKQRARNNSRQVRVQVILIAEQSYQ
jgi:hypothetical protein